jgi:ribosomal protein S27AE
MRKEPPRDRDRVERPRKPENCPACGANAVARIQRGYPAFTQGLAEDLEAGKVVLGGCVMTDDDPRWQCTKCGLKIFPAESKGTD